MLIDKEVHFTLSDRSLTSSGIRLCGLFLVCNDPVCQNSVTQRKTAVEEIFKLGYTNVSTAGRTDKHILGHIRRLDNIF